MNGVFNNNPQYSEIYYDLLFNLDDINKVKIFNDIKKINFENQLDLNESILEKLILTINSYIILNYKKISFSMMFARIYEVYCVLKTSLKLHTKIQLYIVILKNNISINDARILISQIKRFIS